MRFFVVLIVALSFVSLASSSTLRQLFEEENLLDKENTKLSKRAIEVSKESSEEGGSGERIVREASGEEIREKRQVEGSGAEEGRVRRDTSEGESVEDAIFKRDVEGSGVAAIRIRRDASSESSEEVEGSGHGSGQAVHH